MAVILPESTSFMTTVYGTVFAARPIVVQRLLAGDQLILVPDPPTIDEPNVWVHATGGDVLGHLSPELNRWMVPRMFDGARYGARVHSVGGLGTASWKRLVILVTRG